jgi:pre-mRNA-splicing factor CWC22
MAATKMLAHLVNQLVVHELLALEILALFLENPTEDSIEMACDFMIECGQVLSENYPPGVHSIFERFRGILHEGQIDKRVQYTIENLFAIRKTNFKDHPGVLPELDLVPDEERITHQVGLDDKLDPQDILDVFAFDAKYEKSEEEWIEIKAEILGENQGPRLHEAVEEEHVAEEEAAAEETNNNSKIYDFTETDLINLRRTIYLTIISSIDYQECAHKLLKLNMREGQEMELVNMIIECCNQERTYLRFYGLLSSQFCLIKESYKICFERQFEGQYLKIHRLDTNKLRNLAKLFAHLLHTDAIEWYVFRSVKLTEEDTTSSSRIFIKIICQEVG